MFRQVYCSFLNRRQTTSANYAEIQKKKLSTAEIHINNRVLSIEIQNESKLESDI